MRPTSNIVSTCSGRSLTGCSTVELSPSAGTPAPHLGTPPPHWSKRSRWPSWTSKLNPTLGPDGNLLGAYAGGSPSCFRISLASLIYLDVASAGTPHPVP